MSTTQATRPAPAAAHRKTRGFRPLDRLDGLLGRVTMYRLVSLLLGGLAAVAMVFAAIGLLPQFEIGTMLLWLAVMVSVSVATSFMLGKLFGTAAHLESAVITALLLWFIYSPDSIDARLWWAAAATVLANLSKYALAWRRRHLFNPAAVAVVLILVLQEVLGVGQAERLYSIWWIASEPLLPFVAVAALLVLRRTHHLLLGTVFVAVAGGLLVGSFLSQAMTVADSLTFALVASPVFFVAGFMLSEPLTLPPRRAQQLGAAALAGVIATWPIWGPSFAGVTDTSWWIFENWYEVALLTANLVGFVCGQRGRVRLELAGKRELPGEVWAFDFTPHRRLRFAPGQFLELQVPHDAVDRRGTRRVFSIASHPTAETVTVALRIPPARSTYKAALTALEPGAALTATGVGGDFVLPGRTKPVALVAGGIGITPFLAQLPELAGRDAVLVYAVPDGSAVPFRDELAAAGVEVVLVSPDEPVDLPATWRHVSAPFLSADLLDHAIPDLASRRALVSGPPAMVSAVRRGLRGRCAGVRTDSFSGY